MFTDDPNLFYEGDNQEEIEEIPCRHYCKIEKWLRRNGLRLNVNKTEYILFCKPGLNSSNNELNINDDTIPRVKVVSYLRVLLDYHLN